MVDNTHVPECRVGNEGEQPPRGAVEPQLRRSTRERQPSTRYPTLKYSALEGELIFLRKFC